MATRSRKRIGTPWLTQLLAVLGCVIVPAGAAPAALPIPTLELGAHADRVLSVSSDGVNRVLTVSDDRTARVWDARSGRLAAVLRPPRDDTRLAEGQLRAGVFTPDGRHILISGHTRVDSANSVLFAIYVFPSNARNDALPVARINGLEMSVSRLVFSRDGRWLAAMQTNGYPILLIDWNLFLKGDGSAFRQIAVPTSLKPEDIDFSATGDLLAVTRDSTLLRFASRDDFRLSDTRRLPGIVWPSELSISPDGSRLVVGCARQATSVILDADSLAILETIRVPPDTGLANVFAMAWTTDSQSLLLAGGNNRATGGAIVLATRGGSETSFRRLLQTTRRVVALHRLADGSFAFGSAEPGLGLLDAVGRPRWRLGAPVALRPTNSATMAITRDGGSVAVTLPDPQRTSPVVYVTQLKATPAKMVTRPDRVPISAKVHSLPDGSWGRNGSALTVNQVEVQREDDLEFFENSEPVAVTSDSFLVGSTRYLRRVRRDGTSVWTTPLTSEAFRVALSGDGRVAAAWLVDGTIHFYRYADGHEYAAVLIMEGGRDWIVWTPDGDYVSSPSGDNFFGWHLNAAIPSTNIQYGRFYRASQFERGMYRPDLINAIASSQGNMRTRGDTRELARILPPDVELESKGAQTSQNYRTLRLKINGGGALPVSDVTVLVNGIPVLSRAARARYVDQLVAAENTVVLTVPRMTAVDEVRVEVSNGRALGTATLTMSDELPVKETPSGRLFVASIGVSRFRDSRYQPLKFAARDAESISRSIPTLGDGVYSEVRTLTISDGSQYAPDRAVIEAQLRRFLEDVTANDTVIVFLASHGFSDAAGNYYFVPQDANYDDIARAKSLSSVPGTLIPWQFFLATLGDTPGRRVLIVDTCAAAAIEGNTFDTFSLAKRSMSSSFAILTASNGSELSQESERRQHGLFTGGLIEAMQLSVDLDGDGIVSLEDVFEHARTVVDQEYNRAIGPQTPGMQIPRSLKGLPLGRSNGPR